MENASKALLIAGAILICILIIAVGMYIYNSSSSVWTAAASKMSSQEKDIYNSMIKQYIGESKKGSDVKQMIEDIITQNNNYVGESGKFISIHVGNIKGYTNTQKLESLDEAANIYENDSGDNTQVNIDNATAEFRNIKKKITSGNYTVTESSKDGIIYAVTITEYSSSSTPSST